MQEAGDTLERIAIQYRLLVLPGLGGSGPAHWQTHWEGRADRIERVMQDEWLAPVASAWRARLDEVIARQHQACLLIAHSLGCWLVAHWARGGGAGIAGAFLVAPPDLRDNPVPGPIGFDAIAPFPLPFPSLVVASTNDPYARAQRAREFAHAWGAEFCQAEPNGHLGDSAGLHLWPEGIRFLARLAARVDSPG